VELKQIYASINEDLTKVEDALKATSHVDFTWLSQLLKLSLESGGKRIRPALTLLSGKFYNYRFEYLLHMAVSIEIMHSVTLIHDDAIDKSDKRRGKETIFKLWGIQPTILLGDYLFAKAAVSVSDTQSVRCIRSFSQTLMTITRGELNQIQNAFNLSQSHDQYIDRIFSKTGSLFCLATESGGILSLAPESAIEALRNYGRSLGIAFQVVDDILDFTGTEEELGKPAGSDLGQGTLTLPAMLLNKRYPLDNPVKKFFQDREKSEYVRQAIEQVRNSSIVEECYQVARDHCDEACRYIKTLPDSANRQTLFDLADFVVRRKM
jgi:octaprenyl-diphosphate synthase